MSLIIYTMSYGSPGDVEHKYITSPATLAIWQEKAKEAKEKTSFIECIENPKESGKTGNKCLVNIEAVEWVVEGE